MIAGIVNLPIIKYSVEWWNTLHQPASIARFAAPAIDGAMLWPLLSMALAFKLLFICLVCMRIETQIARRRQSVREAGA